MRKFLQRLHHEEEAATAVEYALIVALIGVALIGVLVTFRGSIASMFGKASNAINGSGAE